MPTIRIRLQNATSASFLIIPTPYWTMLWSAGLKSFTVAQYLVPCYILPCGCPIFVLDLSLQQDHKIPQWKYCSRISIMLIYCQNMNNPFLSSLVYLLGLLALNYAFLRWHLFYGRFFKTQQNTNKLAYCFQQLCYVFCQYRIYQHLSHFLGYALNCFSAPVSVAMEEPSSSPAPTICISMHH